MAMNDYEYNKAVRLSPDDAVKANRRLSAYECKDWTVWKDKGIGHRQFAYGDQITKANAATMESRGQYAITINRIRKAINAIAGMLTANMPEFRCVAVGSEDNTKAEMSDRILKYIWGNNSGLAKWRKCVLAGIRDNIGYILVEQNESNETVFKNLLIEDVLVDPGSSDPLFDDAEYIYVKRWLFAADVAREYGISEAELTSSSPLEDGIYQDSTGNRTPIHRVVSTHKDKVCVYMGYKKVVEKQYIEINGTRQFNGAKVSIEKESILGYNHVYKEKLPANLTYYPIVAVFSEDTENPYKLGETHFLVEYQKLINKSFGVMLLNAQLSSNPKVFVYEDTIRNEDVATFESNYAQPGSITKLSGDGSEGKPPIIVQGQPINSAFYQITMMLFSIFEEATLPAEVKGYKDSGAQMYASQILEQREAVMDTFKMLIGQMENAMNRLGKISLQCFAAYTIGEKILRITDAGKVIDSLQVNMSKGLNPMDENSVKMYTEQQIQQGADPMDLKLEIAKAQKDAKMAEGLQVLVNDTSSLDMDVHVVSGSYAPSYSMAKYSVKKELHAAGIVDNESVLEDAPLDNREETIARVSVIQNLKAMNSEQKQLIEEMQMKIQQLEGAMAQGQMSLALSKYEGKLQKDYTQSRGKNSKDVALHRLKLQSEVKDLQHRIELYETEIKASLKQAVEDSDGGVIQLDDLIRN